MRVHAEEMRAIDITVIDGADQERIIQVIVDPDLRTDGRDCRDGIFDILQTLAQMAYEHEQARKKKVNKVKASIKYWVDRSVTLYALFTMDKLVVTRSQAKRDLFGDVDYMQFMVPIEKNKPNTMFVPNQWQIMSESSAKN